MYLDKKICPNVTVQGIFDYIKAKGMKVGVWFEFETVPVRVEQMLGVDDCVLSRNGGIVAPNRPLANMRSDRLLTYLNERVDTLYNMGVRFIKNDHNRSTMIGCDDGGLKTVSILSSVSPERAAV